MRNLKTYIQNLHQRKKDDGISLVETIVYTIILAVVVVGIVTVVVSSTSASSRFTTTTASQADVNRTQAVLFRDLALTQKITEAGGDHIQYIVAQDNTQYKVTVFSYEGETRKDALPTYVKDLLNAKSLMAKLPAEAAVMSVREEIGSSSFSMDTLTKGFDPAAYSNKALWLFTYYDENNDMITLNANKQFDNPAKNRNEISRIAFRIAADAPGRASKVQAESSVTPPLDKSNISNNLTSSNPDDTTVYEMPMCPAQFSAVIPAGKLAATLEWSQVQGATQYYITRFEFRNSKWLEQKQYTIDNPSVTTFTEPANSLVWGGKYQYAITVENIKGATDNCVKTSEVSAVPIKFDFSNINPHAYSDTVPGENLQENVLTGLKKNNSVNTLKSGITVKNVTRSASTINPLANARYTVARGTTNQVAWGGTFGATEYQVYRDGKLVSTIPAQTSGNDEAEATAKYSYQDPSRAYGSAHTYTVLGANSGGGAGQLGEGKPSAAVKLFSPPAATSTYKATGNDTAGTKSSNLITLTKIAPNTVGFQGKYNTSIKAASCTTLDKIDAASGKEGYNRGASFDMVGKNNAKPTDFMTIGDGAAYTTATQPNVEWGSTTCYRMIPYNDAGSYPYAEGSSNATAVVKANQKPERFTIRNVKTTNKFYNLDYSNNARLNNPFYRADDGWTVPECLLYAGPSGTSWGTDDLFCNGAASYAAGYRSPVGATVPSPGENQIFVNSAGRQIYGNQQAMTVTWNTSNGAYGGYNVIRDITAKGNGAIQGYEQTRKIAVPYAKGSKLTGGFQISGEWPGAKMKFEVQSKAANGLIRSGGSTNYASSPAPSKNTSSAVHQTCSNGVVNTPTQYFTGPSHGDINSYSAVYNTAGQIATGNVAITRGGSDRFWGHAMTVGPISISRIGHWSAPISGEQTSITTYGGGRISNLYCVSNGGFWPNNYPTYWGNMSMRYSGADTLYTGNSGNKDTYWPNYDKSFASDETIPNPIPPAEKPPKDWDFKCSSYLEDSAEFITNNCKPGQGIPVAPKNVKATQQGANVLITWSGVNGATGYTLNIKKGVADAYAVQSSGTSYTLKNVTPGDVYVVNVFAKNKISSGAASNDVVFTIKNVVEEYNWMITPVTSGDMEIISWEPASNNIVSTTVKVMDPSGTQILKEYAPTGTSITISHATLQELSQRLLSFKLEVSQTGSDGIVRTKSIELTPEYM